MLHVLHLVAHLQDFALDVGYEVFLALSFVLPLFSLFFDEVFVNVQIVGAGGVGSDASSSFGLELVFLY